MSKPPQKQATNRLLISQKLLELHHRWQSLQLLPRQRLCSSHQAAVDRFPSKKLSLSSKHKLNRDR